MTGLLKLRRGDRLVLATHNQGKIAEFQDLLEPFGLELVSAGELNVPEPDETGTSFIENARIKAHASAQAAGMIALADDSGLCVDALGGDPGVYTANWAGSTAHGGRDYMVGMRRVEDALQAAGVTDRSQSAQSQSSAAGRMSSPGAVGSPLTTNIAQSGTSRTRTRARAV